MKSKTPTVSVIVPVYKAEKYLRKCLDSLLAQTFKDFELLLIDDGSPDKSGAICDEYARRDTRIHVFHKANSGVSAARQFGLDKATGIYVIHADPDDWVEHNMLEVLIGEARKGDYDMVICDFYATTSCGEKYITQCPSSFDHVVVRCELFRQLHGSCCNKLVKRICYNKFGVRFPQDFSFCEDLYTNVVLLGYPLKISYVPQAFYHYDQKTNVGSIVRTYDEATYCEDLNMLHAFEKILKGCDCYKEGMASIKYLILKRAFFRGNFPAQTFAKRFRPYKKSLPLKRNVSRKERIILWAACTFLYVPLHYLYKLYLTHNA